MNFRIIQRDSFSVIGKSTIITHVAKYEQLPQFWSCCHSDGTIKMLHTLGDDTIIGVGDNNSSGNDSFRYMIGTSSDINPPVNLDSWIIPASTWIVFDPVLSIPELVGSVWKYIFNDFLPNNDYLLAPTPDLEVNQKINHSDADYTCEIWIPVLRKP